MKLNAPLLALACGLALIAADSGRFDTPLEMLPHVSSDDGASAAIDVRCGSLSGEPRWDCVRELNAQFAEGTHQPETILRNHCTQFRNVWTFDPEEPPEVCVQRYGGWLNR